MQEEHRPDVRASESGGIALKMSDAWLDEWSRRVARKRGLMSSWWGHALLAAMLATFICQWLLAS